MCRVDSEPHDCQLSTFPVVSKMANASTRPLDLGFGRPYRKLKSKFGLPERLAFAYFTRVWCHPIFEFVSLPQPLDASIGKTRSIPLVAGKNLVGCRGTKRETDLIFRISSTTLALFCRVCLHSNRPFFASTFSQ